MGLTISFSFMMIVNLIVGNALKELWNVLETIQFIYFMKYCNFFLPFTIVNLVEYFQVQVFDDLSASMEPIFEYLPDHIT